VFPAIPEQPTQEQAKAALGVLLKLLATFPFETEADRSVALAAILTATIRPILRVAPLFGFSSHDPGSGKGMLTSMVAIIGNGHEAPALTVDSRDEARKSIDGAILDGAQIILLDNIDIPIGWGFLCSRVTENPVRLRPLGGSKVPVIPNTYMFLATGNNLTFTGDMKRRTLVCVIDPQHEHPEERVFHNDPIADAKRDRPQLLAAALTILRGYLAAGRPDLSNPLGSFKDWNLVRDALIWLGRADPCDTRTRFIEDDPEREQLAQLLGLWGDVIGTARITVKELIAKAQASRYAAPGEGEEAAPRLWELLHEIAADDHGGISAERLGCYLRQHKGQVRGGRRLVIGGTHAGTMRWRLDILGR
jgi:putative DNA primase/helicase